MYASAFYWLGKPCGCSRWLHLRVLGLFLCTLMVLMPLMRTTRVQICLGCRKLVKP